MFVDDLVLMGNDLTHAVENLIVKFPSIAFPVICARSSLTMVSASGACSASCLIMLACSLTPIKAAALAP